jgi:hypothetical protein
MAANRRALPHENVVDAGAIVVAKPRPSKVEHPGARLMEESMANAIKQALAEGISINSPEIKARIMAARRG